MGTQAGGLQPSPGSCNRFAVLSDDSLTSGQVEASAILRMHPKVLPDGQKGFLLDSDQGHLMVVPGAVR